MIKWLRRSYLSFIKMDKPLFISSFLLALFGILMILLSSSIRAGLYNSTPLYYAIRQAIAVGGSLAVGFVILGLDSKYYDNIAFWGIIATFFVTLIMLISGFGFGSSNIEAVTWDIGITDIQPAEFFKILFALYIGEYYGKWANKEKSKNKSKYFMSIMMPIFICAVPAFFVLNGGDYGSAAIIVAIVGLIILFVPSKDVGLSHLKKTIAVCLVLAVVSLVYGYKIFGEDRLKESSRLSRFIYKDPCYENYKDLGYQTCNGYIAIDSGGLTGVGLGNSTQKYLYLPESHTDFIFPIICEETGIIGGVLVILIYMFMLYRIFKIATNTYDLKNSLVAFGIGIYLFLQIIVNLGGVLAIMPLTGVPLPLLSYGGSSCLATFMGLAIVQKINADTLEERKKRKKAKLANK